MTPAILALEPTAAPGAEPTPSTAATSSSSPAPTLVAPAFDPAVESALLKRLGAGTLAPGFLSLGSEEAPFLAWFVPAEKLPARGALLVIPAAGRFIGDDAVVGAYMRQFPPGGWHVLAVQTPLLPSVNGLEVYAAVQDVAVERARAGLAYLAGKGEQPVVIAGQGSGAALAGQLAAGPASKIAAVAALGPWPGELGSGTTPMLDLSSDRDPAATELVQQRRQAAREIGRMHYDAYAFAGADRVYLGFEDDIARRVRGWAEHLPPPPPPP